jgi:hypothetical protein
MRELKYFTVLGERCSGTHFVQYAIHFNFCIDFFKGSRHFFGHGDDHNEVTPQKTHNFYDPEETLYVCVVRDPVEWVDSFYKQPHHVPHANKRNPMTFMTNEFHSIHEEGAEKNEEIMEDRHIETKQRYKDIFELRRVKNNYMMNELPRLVPYTTLIRYEDMRDRYDETLNRLATVYSLKRRFTDRYVKTIKYKGTYNAMYFRKPVLLDSEEQDYVRKHVDREQEDQLGYV